MRADGTRVRDLSPIVQSLPYVMPKRYDAQNWASDFVDEDIIRDYIRSKRKEGHAVTHMDTTTRIRESTPMISPALPALLRK